jgi:hypothetical protein
MNNPERSHLLGVLAGLFLAAVLVLSALLLSRAWLRIAESQTISVTGSARKNVRADLVVWKGTFSTEANTLVAAQRALKADLEKVGAYLRANHVTNYSVSTISIQELRASERNQNEGLQQKTVGYRLSQWVEVRSPEIDRITELDRDSVALVERGVLFTTALEYIYTKSGETKVEMLAEATKDAHVRAQQMAGQGGRAIHQLRSAKMGVFQITPLYSIQTSSEGINDNTSPEKTLTAVVTANFSMR